MCPEFSALQVGILNTSSLSPASFINRNSYKTVGYLCAHCLAHPLLSHVSELLMSMQRHFRCGNEAESHG